MFKSQLVIFSAFGQRLRELCRRKRLDGDLDDEVNLHLAMLEEEFRSRGMTPKEAEAAARREFGGVMRTKEAYRDERGFPWLETLAQDVRYALRGLRASPGFTAAAVLSLALGIGANTAIFSLFHALLLRMLPVVHPRELVMLHIGSGAAGFASNELYWQLAKRTDLFNGVLARSGGGRIPFRRKGEDRAESARNEPVSGNYFAVLGIQPELGRFFTETETATDEGRQLVVLSHDFWQNRFGGDPKILGQQLEMIGKPFTIIGVAPPGFFGVAVESRTEMWRPGKITTGHNMSWLFLIARRRPDVSARQLQSALDVLMAQYQAMVMGAAANSEVKRKALNERIEVRDAGVGLSFLREQFAGPLRVLMAVVLLVLLATCTNLAHLLLARGAARRKETAVRLALGAGRARLVRQALTESFLLAWLGTLLGVALAFWGERYLMLFVPTERAGSLDASPDSVVMLFTGAVAFFSTLLFGLAPALRSTAVDPVEGLRSGTGAAGGRRSLRPSLVVLQVTFSVVLVALAGLFSHSLQALRAVDIGFHDQSVLTFWLDYPQTWKSAQEESARARFLAEATAIPGVLSASYDSPDIFQGRSWPGLVDVPGSNRTQREPGIVSMASVGPRYLETLGTAPLSGREFDPNDTAASAKVAMVNEAFVRAFLGGGSPLGRVLSFPHDEPKDRAPRTIVGVVHDIAHEGVRGNAGPAVYLPHAQIEDPFGAPSFLVRAAIPASAAIPQLRRIWEKIAPGTWRGDVSTVRQRIDDSIFADRMLATLSGFFGVLALLLAAVGLYGVVAYNTARRAGEIGIRLALGAERSDVLFMVLRDALLLVALGLFIGLPCALAAGRAVSSVLFGIKPGDPAALLVTAGALLAIGVAAAFGPARRAATMDPMRALRHD